jgi:hypothetical protein
VKREPRRQLVAGARSGRQLSEQAELDGAQQGLRAPECEAEFHDSAGFGGACVSSMDGAGSVVVVIFMSPFESGRTR